MVAPFDADPRLFRASALVVPGNVMGEPPWAEPGRLVEFTGGVDGACTSTAVAAVVDAQGADEVVVWVQPRQGLLFPPDLAASGVDLDALVVVHVPVRAVAATSRDRPRRDAVRADHELAKAAELLLRSGAIDLLVLDWRPHAPPRGAWLVRLQALAREHRSRVLLLTDARMPLDAGSALVLRIEPVRRRAANAFTIEPVIRRDKRNAARPPSVLARSAPDGLS